MSPLPIILIALTLTAGIANAQKSETGLKSEWPAFQKAVGKNDVAAIKKALKASPALARYQHTNGTTPLHLATSKEATEILVQAGAKLEAANKAGWTALHMAAIRDRVPVAKALLKAGANVDAKTKKERTALHFCAERNKLTMATALLENGAKVSAADITGWPPLHFASVKGHLDMMKLLLTFKADINQASDGGGTPLIEAAVGQSADILAFLIEQGAEVNAKTKEGRTALSYAEEFKNEEAAKLLRKHGRK